MFFYFILFWFSLPEGNIVTRTNVLSLLLQVKKKRPGRDGKMAGLVPVLYVNQSWFLWHVNHVASSMNPDIMTCLASSFFLSIISLPDPTFSSAGPPQYIYGFCSWILQLVCSLTLLHPDDVCFVIHYLFGGTIVVATKLMHRLILTRS